MICKVPPGCLDKYEIFLLYIVINKFLHVGETGVWTFGGFTNEKHKRAFHHHITVWISLNSDGKQEQFSSVFKLQNENITP